VGGVGGGRAGNGTWRAVVVSVREAAKAARARHYRHQRTPDRAASGEQPCNAMRSQPVGALGVVSERDAARHDGPCECIAYARATSAHW
jgi:hypothetical protein